MPTKSKSQSVIVSEKKVKKSTNKYKPSIAVAFFEQRLRNDLSMPELREKVMADFVNLAATGKYTYVCEITTQLNRAERFFLDLANKYPELKPAYEHGKQFLGMTGLVGGRDFKYKDTFIKPYLHDLLPSHRDVEDREHERAKELRKASQVQESLIEKRFRNIMKDEKTGKFYEEIIYTPNVTFPEGYNEKSE